jgi:hypothetical protein
MQVRKILLRTSKVLGKAIVGLLVLLLITLLILHVPAVQRRLTPWVTDQLSSRLHSRVEIEDVRFNLLGDVTISGLKVWDPKEFNIFSSGDIEVTTSIFNLIRGNLVFDKIRVAGISGNLAQDKNGLNIQFIIDAFARPPSTAPSTSSPNVNLQFKSVELDSIKFNFTSTNGTIVDALVGKFSGEDIRISVNPNKIIAAKVYLDNSSTRVLYRQSIDTTRQVVDSTASLFVTDFGSGFDFDIKDIQLNNDHVTIHRDTVLSPPKFDPNHLDIKNIHLNLSDIRTDSMSLSGALHSLSGNLNGFILSDAKAGIQLTRDAITLTGLHVASDKDEVNGDVSVGYISNSTSKDAYFDTNLSCRIDPRSLAYFLDDSIAKYFNRWEPAEIKLNSNYSNGEGKIEMFGVRTGNNEVEANGTIYNVLNPERMSWKQMNIRVVLGKEFRTTLAPLIAALTLPPDANVQVVSTGDLKELSFDGQVNSTWGNVKTNGIARNVTEELSVDAMIDAHQFDVGKWIKQSWIGPVDLNAKAIGNLNRTFALDVNGTMASVQIINKAVHAIGFDTRVTEDSAIVTLAIADTAYRSEINSEISFANSVVAKTKIRFHGFNAGQLFDLDSILDITGSIRSTVRVDGDVLEASAESDSTLITNRSSKYFLDTLTLNALLSPRKSDITYHTNNEHAEIVSNFDVREAKAVFNNWSDEMLNANAVDHSSRMARVNVSVNNPTLFQLLGMDVNGFSSLYIAGELDEQNGTADLIAYTGSFNGYGMTMDSLNAAVTVVKKQVNADLDINDLKYNSIDLGNLYFDVVSKGDSSQAKLTLSKDSVTTLNVPATIIRSDTGFVATADKVIAFDQEYSIKQDHPLYISKTHVLADNLSISGRDMSIKVDGDMDNFTVDLQNVNLVPLNDLLFPDTTVINKGVLTGSVSYSTEEFNLKARVDSLRLYNSDALAISAAATTEKKHVPFQFLLTNTSNKIELRGDYAMDQDKVDASLKVDVNNLEIFSFLISDFVSEMDGAITGDVAVKGKANRPEIKGQLRLVDVDLTTVNPKLEFKVKDDIILIDSSSLKFNNFTIYDRKENPLVINGKLSTKDYESFAYNLRLNTDQYYLIDNPDSSNNRLRGSLVVSSKVKLVGNEKDTNVEADVTVKNATSLTAVSSSNDIELLKSEGIIDFVDPSLWMDTTSLEVNSSFYDSLIASLPDFNLNSTIKIEPNAVLNLVVDEQSGDYAQSSGDGSLELGYDRTGNVRLSGTYTIRKGLYRLSFYDLVKKTFTLVPGSSITWSGDPESGELDIKAQYVVETNSIGLIGQEIGENEKSIYKRSLDYEVGIIIKGTIEKPIVSFSLDLPEKEKANYPVLANKLDRLRQPEYASELNKQVFGLLVLGGFLPETGADVNQNVIATTAISNSVNTLLANQLNRFASQYVKGVNIDVGIQSYSDYSAPGGKTRTAMDFRVSKSIMNDRLSFEIGGDFDINADQSGANSGKNYRGDIAIIYDLTGGGDKQLKLFNNETYDIVYQEIRNTGISLIFIREFSGKKGAKNKNK